MLLQTSSGRNLIVPGPDRALYRFLDTDGDGGGTKNANGDYSSAADEFLFTAPSPCYLNRMILSVGDTSGMQAQEYGNLGSALTNGITVTVEAAAGHQLKDLTDGVPITTNAEIARLCYDVDVKTWGSGSELLNARWTFAKAGSPLYLNTSQQLIVTLNDDLTGLLSHYFMVQGYLL